MAKKKPSFQYDPKWAEAKTKCRLNANDVEMAKRLGFTPKALLKNIPGPKEQWKQPVKFWIRDLYLEKYGSLPGQEEQKAETRQKTEKKFETKPENTPETRIFRKREEKKELNPEEKKRNELEDYPYDYSMDDLPF